MEANGRAKTTSPGGEVLDASRARLLERRDALAPLVADWERIGELEASFGETPPPPAGGPQRKGTPQRLHADLLQQLHDMRAELRKWSQRLEPLVHEHDRIVHVLDAYDSADALPHDPASRRSRAAGRHATRRSAPQSPAAQARQDALRGLLAEPRTRADLADRLSLSPSRVTELLEPLARAGEVVEIPDPARANRKLWALAPNGAAEAEPSPLD